MEVRRQKYGLGKQDFKSLRNRDFVYVDKTDFIIRLLEGTDYYFLSRPRRFGKTLFISTLYNFFKGNRELFKGLAIDSYDWNWETYPVIRINLGEGSYSRADGLTERLNEILSEIEKSYGLDACGNDPRSRLHNLILTLNEHFQNHVVVLIDEYEKPLLDTINENFNQRYQKELADFYSVLKNNEESIRFLFVTGVTRFGHLNIFSGFNNLTDISIDDEYASICGITQEEILTYLSPGINELADAWKCSFDDTIAKLKQNYDGYHFSASMVDIYNPFSLLTCLQAKRLSSTWFQSASSRYLLDNLRRNRYDLTALDGSKVDENKLLGSDATMHDPITLLYQSGYLTIKGFNPITQLYTLGLPNQEVATALYSIIIPYYLGANYSW